MAVTAPREFSVEELRRDAEVARANVAEIAATLRSEIAETAQHVRESFAPSAIKAQVKDYVRDNVHSLGQQVRTHPIEAAAVGAGLAYPLWKLLRKVPAPLLLIGAGFVLSRSPKAEEIQSAPTPLPVPIPVTPPRQKVARSAAKAVQEIRPEESPPTAAPDDAVTRDGSIWQAAKQAASQWVSHKDSRMGAALSYYSVFSIGPLILIAVAIAGLVLGREAVQGQVTASLQGLLGENGANAINGMLQSADKPAQGIVATTVGGVTLLFAAIGVVVQLKDAFNTVWEVPPSKGGGIWSFIRTYILSLAGVMAVGFLLLVSMLLTTALAAFGKYFGTFLPEVLIQVVGFAVSFAVIALLFALMFKWLPDAPVRWSDVWLGAILTAVLFEVGKFLIGLYIGKQGLESTYGAASSLVVVLIWVYYSAQLVLLGAEFTNVRAKQRGYSPKKA